MKTDLAHQVADGVVCNTEGPGHATPGGRSPTSIIVDATEGFIPLWQPGSMLRWRFQERSFARAADAAAQQETVLDLIGEALLAWGAAGPVQFTRNDDLWDFEVVLRGAPECSPQGCVLASAFFPDAGRHELTIFPTMFDQPRQEQVETLIHEFGHVFGLRHFFAQVSETAWPSQAFGTQSPFSIMSYGPKSTLTEADLHDLTELYRLVWTGRLTHINRTPVHLVQPYSSVADRCPPVTTGTLTTV